MRNLATSGYVFDFETCGLDGKPRIFVGKKVFRPTIQFNPFKISLYKVVDITEAEADDLLNRTLYKYEKYIEKSMKSREEYEKYKNFDTKERMPIWGVVRYRNGEYDNVWRDNMTKRDAEKLCEKLNSDYHKYYGDYVVEMNP